MNLSAQDEVGALEATALSISLTVQDLHKSLTWYRDIVGFAVDREHVRDGKLMGVSLRAGAARLLLNQDDGSKGWDRAKGEGFSFMLTTPQDIDALARRVKDAGGSLQSEPVDAPWGARFFRLTDPDGFKFVISSERK